MQAAIVKKKAYAPCHLYLEGALRRSFNLNLAP